MNQILLLFSFTMNLALAQKPGEFYLNRKIIGQVYAGEYLIILCENQAATCVNDTSVELCKERNKTYEKYRYPLLNCVELKKFSSYDECRQEQYNLIYQKIDYLELCKIKLKEL